MSPRCNASDPDNPEHLCRKPPDEHEYHAGRTGTWVNPDYSGPTMDDYRTRRPSKGGRKRKMAALVGPTESAPLPPLSGGTGVPPEAAECWDAQEWTAQAKATVRSWLDENSDRPFTTAEDWWPLLDRPEEMRAMSRVVQSLLREGEIEEVGSKRLRGVYCTRDGHSFSENKLVPVYRARSASGS